MPLVELQCWDLWVDWGCQVTSALVSCSSLGDLLRSEGEPLCLHCISLQDGCSLLLTDEMDLPGAYLQAPELKYFFVFLTRDSLRIYLAPSIHSQWHMFATCLKIGDIVHLKS